MMRKILPIIASLLMVMLMLSGCTEHEKQESYTLKEIYSTGDFGFFVKDGKTFYPVKYINDDNNEGFQWCVGEIDCPKVTKDTPLVAVFDTNAEMPEDYFIESYESLGYSVGANISIGDDQNSLWLKTSGTCKNSDLDKSFAEENFDDVIEIESINGQKPLSNVDTDVNILIGLQKNKYYDFSVFVGTQNRKGSICADTFVMKLTGITNLENPLFKTDKQYFVVNLPQNIKPGYYDINKEGFFKI